MDKLAYHLNKKKKPAKTKGKFFYYYPCTCEDNSDVWYDEKAYIVLEVSESEWEALFELGEQGKGKTADDIHSLLNIIFKAAIKHNIIHSNPMDMVFHTKHEQQHGTALTKDEEQLLLSLLRQAHRNS